MIAIPISLCAALILIWFVLRRSRLQKFDALALLVSFCAAQGVIISLAQYWEVAPARALQPLSAVIIPPTAWLAFTVSARRAVSPFPDMLHCAAPLLVAFAMVFAPNALDAIVPVVFGLYGGALFWTLWRGSDTLPRVRLGAGTSTLTLWRIIAIALLASALSDVLIVGVQIAGLGSWQPWIISVTSTGILLLIGGLSLAQDPAPSTAPNLSPRHDEDVDSDREVMTKVHAHMVERRVYLDPDLTLERLARQVMIPAKQVSGAINRQTGENVSRFVNGQRVEAAKIALQGGSSVTEAQLAAGFNTKSNFNREFLRVTGVSPSVWVENITESAR